jgi:hypothetical protein
LKGDHKLKRLFLALFLFVTVTFCASAQTPQPDFRNVQWGMTKEQVKSAETKECDGEDAENILYEIEIDGNSCSLLYNFKHNTLYTATIIINGLGDTVFDDCYDIYTSFRDMLNKKYGQFIGDEFFANKDEYDSEDTFENQFLLQNVYANPKWETETTLINLSFYNSIKTKEHNIYITYTSKKLKKWADEEIEKEKLSNL